LHHRLAWLSNVWIVEVSLDVLLCFRQNGTRNTLIYLPYDSVGRLWVLPERGGNRNGVPHGPSIVHFFPRLLLYT
jgi:hypothetical protein